MEHYSHTRLELFEACPGAYFDKYEAKLPEPPSEPLEIGKPTHDIILTYNQHCLQKGVESDVTAMPEIARRKFFENPIPLNPSKFSEILKLAENYATGHLIDPNTKVGFEEKVLLFRPTGSNKWISMDPETPNRDRSFWQLQGDAFWGVIDDLAIENDTAIITDYKSSWEIASQSSVDTNPQLDRYGWVVALEYPQIQYFKMKLDFVRWKVVRERKHVMTREQALAVQADVDARINQIKAARRQKKFPRWPGHHCSWCPRVVNCTEARKFAESLVVNSQADAEKILEDIILLDGYNKARKKLLKGYCQSTGSVVKNGVEIGYRRVESLGIPKEKYREFFELLKVFGEDPWDYIKVSKTDIKHLFDRQDIGDRLRAMAVDESYTRFDVAKLKGDDE